MQIFAGLGNPGPEYALNRHNIGFMVVDVLREMHGFSPWKQAFQGLACSGYIGRARVLLLKPLTYMNESGRSVGEALRFYKLPVTDLTVFHDDLDLDPLRVKVKRGGGAGGHNGLKSIDRHVGPEYRRVRIGIGHPPTRDMVLKYVLGNFPKAVHDDIADFLGDIGDFASLLAEGQDDKFMNRLATRRQPPQ